MKLEASQRLHTHDIKKGVWADGSSFTFDLQFLKKKYAQISRVGSAGSSAHRERISRKTNTDFAENSNVHKLAVCTRGWAQRKHVVEGWCSAGVECWVCYHVVKLFPDSGVTVFIITKYGKCLLGRTKKLLLLKTLLWSFLHDNHSIERYSLHMRQNITDL